MFVLCNDSFSLCHIATLMCGVGRETCGLGLGLGKRFSLHQRPAVCVHVSVYVCSFAVCCRQPFHTQLLWPIVHPAYVMWIVSCSISSWLFCSAERNAPLLMLFVAFAAVLLSLITTSVSSRVWSGCKVSQ